MSLVNVHDGGQVVQIDQARILRALNLNPDDPNTQALLLVCDRYSLDPLLKHMVLIQGRPYITRDGYLHIAHLSGRFDGMEVVDSGETNSEWWAKVSVYRKDMGRPFTYIGRYPKQDAKHMAKYGPEMAIKTAEVMALRRAFDVTGVGAADEQWDTVDVQEAAPAAPAEELATQEHLDTLRSIAGQLNEDQQARSKAWRTEQGIVYTLGVLTVPQFERAAEYMEGLVREGEPVEAVVVEDRPVDVETGEIVYAEGEEPF